MDFIAEFLAIVGAWLAGFWGLVSDTIDGSLALFYNSVTNNLTIFGILSLFGLAVGLVYMGLQFVQRLLRK